MADTAKKEFLAQQAKALAELAAVYGKLAALADDEPEGQQDAPPGVPASSADTALNDALARLPLADAIVTYLRACRKPQTRKQIAAALKKAGREFHTDNPIRAVKDALKKTLTKNPDLFHIRWAQWHLRSKHSKAALDKLLLPNVNFGTAGRSPVAHGVRTRKGMERARASGKQIGANLKMTDEKIALIRQLILDGASASAACRKADVSAALFFLYRSKPNGPFSDLTLKRGRQAARPAESAPVLRVVK